MFLDLGRLKFAVIPDTFQETDMGVLRLQTICKSNYKWSAPVLAADIGCLQARLRWRRGYFSASQPVGSACQLDGRRGPVERVTKVVALVPNPPCYREFCAALSRVAFFHGIIQTWHCFSVFAKEGRQRRLL